jgi:hypothetical protein
MEGLDEAQKLAIGMAERAGMLEAYGNVFKHAHGTVPSNLPRSFIGWSRQLRPKRIASEVLNYLKDEFGGFISFKSAQSIGAIISDGEIVHLVPCQLIGDAPVGGAVIRQTGDQLVVNVQQWVRTKYGYVAGKGVFADSLRKKSVGEFANPIL